MITHRTVTLVGGPLDGELLDVTLIEDLSGGVALPAAGCAYPGGRSLYDPRHTLTATTDS